MIAIVLPIIQVVVTVAAFLAAFLVIATKHRTAANIWLSVVACASGVWSLGIALFLGSTDHGIATVIVYGFYLAAIAIPYALLEFSLAFPYETRNVRRERIMALAIYIGASLFALIPGNVVAKIHVLPGEQNVVDLNLWGYLVYSAAFMVLASAAFMHYMRSLRKSQSLHDLRLGRKLKGLIVAMALALSGGSVFNLILPLLGNYHYIWAGPLFSCLFSGYVFYAATKQGLLNIREAAARSIGYVLLLVGLGVVYLVLFFVIMSGILPFAYDEQSRAVTYVLVSILIAFTVTPVKQWIDQFTFGVFYHGDYSTHTVLREFSSITANEIELKVLVRRAIGTLTNVLAPRYASLYILGSRGETHYYTVGGAGHATPAEKKYQLELVREYLDDLPQIINLESREQQVQYHQARRTHASVIVKLIVRGEQVGILFLGRRQNGQLYREKDLQLFETAGEELALAIQNGLRFEEIRQFNRRLRQEVNTATRQLRHSNQQLHKLDEVKDEFLSIASHQLRTPLTSIKGYISLVLDGDAGRVNPQQRHLLEEAFDSSQRMVSLIEDFLNMSRLQTGRFMIDKQPTDFTVMVKKEVEHLRTTIETRSLKLKYTQSNDVPVLLIDESKLRQVVMNFIDNAMYYSQDNSTIRVKVYREDKSVVFEVHDTGIGVPVEEQSRLFTKFYRASNARKRRPDGTGVGLYLAKKVVTEHGGDIIFHSTEGKGSVFGFKLPLSLAAELKNTDNH